ncbi:unnamed protein product [Caenorhabditis bovis]|uniref:Uncharacterized protein n=1 Tax=Caenorhabditis bovis TaxID=2654633 RepID=A0A8S1EDN3_9PELO|nr:unnamed protein product [Caenorhabditis bovis]
MGIVLKFALIFAAASIGAISAKRVAVRAVGQYYCRGEPLVNHTVWLIERNNIFGHTKITSVQTDRKGQFDISGNAVEWWGDPRPAVYIEHRCADEPRRTEGKICTTSETMDIPKAFQNQGYLPKYTMHLSLRRLDEPIEIHKGYATVAATRRFWDCILI